LPLFGDSYLDCVPQSQITVTPVTQGVAVAPATIISATSMRTRAVVSVEGGQLQKWLGLQIEWSD